MSIVATPNQDPIYMFCIKSSLVFLDYGNVFNNWGWEVRNKNNSSPSDWII